MKKDKGIDGQIKKYKNLSPLQRTVIQLLSIQYYELRQIDLINCLTSLGYKDDLGQPFKHPTIRPVILALENESLIIKNPKGIKCTESLWREAVQDAIVEGRFSAMASAVLTTSPFPVVSWSSSKTNKYAFKKFEEMIRALQMAIFGGSSVAQIDEVYMAGMYTTVFEAPCLFLLNAPFQPHLLDHVEAATLWNTLPYILAEANRRMTPVSHIVDYYLSRLSDSQGNENRYKISEYYLLGGQIDAAIQLLDDFQKDETFKMTSDHLAQLGWAETLRNNIDKALDFFNEALNAVKKETRKRKIFLKGYAGFFFLIALLKSEKKKNFKTALDHIDTVVKRRDEYLFFEPIAAMRSVFEERSGIYFERKGSGENWSEYLGHGIEQLPPIQSFFILLVMNWADPKNAKQHRPTLSKIGNRVAGAGYVWIEAEISALAAAWSKGGKENKKRSEMLHDQLGTRTLVHLVTPVPKWEKSLNALIQIAESTAPNLGEKDDVHAAHGQRLVWLLHYEEKDNTCSVTPRLQKLSKGGTWTKGRAVALKNLQRNHGTMKGLTDQDRRVCGSIAVENYYGYNNVEYYIDEESALPALVGHPLVFLESALESPVELVKGEPEIRFREEGSGTHISMHPVPENEEDRVSVVKETPSRFKVIRFSPEHLKIAGIIGNKGLKLPGKSRDMVGRAVTAISSLITVHSDMALPDTQNETLKEMEADVTPHAHVMPWQEGIKVQFLVRPFGNVGSYYRPGRGGSHVFAEIEGEKVQAVRDQDQEERRMKAVIDRCTTLQHLEEVNGEWLVGDPEEALELLLALKNCNETKEAVERKEDGKARKAEKKARNAEVEERDSGQPPMLILKWPQGEKIRVRSQVSFNDFKMSVKKDRDWFKATGSLTIDEDLALDLKQLMTLLETSSAQGRFVTLDDGTFLALTRSFKARLEELRAYATVHGKGVRFNPLAVPAIEELTDKVGALRSDKAWKVHCKKLKEVIQPEVPGTLRARLRDYQITGFNWLAQLAHWHMGACLADDMGLGKTVQALSAILLHADQGPALVVAPVSVMGNWQEECGSFAPTLTPRLFGPGDRQQFLDSLGPFDVVIASYGLLQMEAEKLAAVKWQTIVLDEAQAIKNAKTKRSRAAMTLGAPFRIITTGTPVENHLEELWTLFNFLNPGLLGSLTRFRNVFALPIEKNHDSDASRRLKKLIRPFILRRMKTDVLHELPEKTEITLKVEMSQEEAVLYEVQRLKSLENIEQAGDDAPGQKHFRILAELTRLRQLCCNPSLVLPDAGIRSAKLNVFGNVVTELLANNHNALVFSQFVGHLAIIRKFLDGRGISYQYLDGSTSAKDRRDRINAFQSGVGDLFLISLKAGGHGLNLTAADYVIHMDPWWNPAVEDQASDRAHRIGQTRPVTVYRLVVKDSIEEQIVNLHKEKRELAESLLAGSEAAGRISATELLALLKGTS